MWHVIIFIVIQPIRNWKFFRLRNFSRCAKGPFLEDRDESWSDRPGRSKLAQFLPTHCLRVLFQLIWCSPNVRNRKTLKYDSQVTTHHRGISVRGITDVSNYQKQKLAIHSSLRLFFPLWYASSFLYSSAFSFAFHFHVLLHQKCDQMQQSSFWVDKDLNISRRYSRNSRKPENFPMFIYLSLRNNCWSIVPLNHADRKISRIQI